MATEFERIKHDVAGRSVTVTSWFDGREGVWRASAPAYAYLFTVTDGEPSGADSRKAAIDAVTNRLSHYFQTSVS